MAILDNARHEAFAQGLAKGMTHEAAFQAAGYKSHRSNAARLSGNDSVRKRVAELQEAQAAKSELGRDQLRQFYIGVILAKPSDAGPDNPLCELRMSKAGPYYAFPCKLGAAAALAKQCGWNEPERHEVAHNGLESIVAAIVGGKAA